MEECQVDHVPGTRKQARSPPLAFEKTPNDALWAPANPALAVPYATTAWTPETEMQAQLDKQAEALRLQHQAFEAERESWQLERERLYRRVAALETLLKMPSGQSPVKSPAMSPSVSSVAMSGSSTLAGLAEVDGSASSSHEGSPSPTLLKRGLAPVRLDLSNIARTTSVDDPVESALVSTVSEVERELGLPSSPPATRNTLSPPPLANRHLAGHTPLKAPRPDGISPTLSVFSERLADTPTRSNTQLNETMNADDDRSLTGPLHMPELPSNPGSENFTMDMLDAKLKHVMEHPEENQPFACRVAGRDVPAPSTDGANEGQSASGDSHHSASAPKDAAVVSDDLDNGGIRLRQSKTSNFGAPLGQLAPWKQ